MFPVHIFDVEEDFFCFAEIKPFPFEIDEEQK